MKKTARPPGWFYWWIGLICFVIMITTQEIIRISSFEQCFDMACRNSTKDHILHMFIIEALVLAYFCFMFFAMRWVYRKAEQAAPQDKTWQGVGNALGIATSVTGLALGMIVALLF